MGCSRTETIFRFRFRFMVNPTIGSCGNLLPLVESWKLKPIIGDQTQNHQGTEVWFLPLQLSVCLRMRHVPAAA